MWKTCPIGAVKIKNNKIITSQIFEVYIKNTKDISSKSIEVHGIRPIDLKDAKEPEAAIKEFLHFIGSATLVGYYLEFDVNMINKYIKPVLGAHNAVNDAIMTAMIYLKLKSN